jgi:hypothetical protein
MAMKVRQLHSTKAREVDEFIKSRRHKHHSNNFSKQISSIIKVLKIIDDSGELNTSQIIRDSKLSSKTVVSALSFCLANSLVVVATRRHNEKVYRVNADAANEFLLESRAFKRGQLLAKVARTAKRQQVMNKIPRLDTVWSRYSKGLERYMDDYKDIDYEDAVLEALRMKTYRKSEHRRYKATLGTDRREEARIMKVLQAQTNRRLLAG